jgi:GTP-binding protein HflX
MAEDMLFATLDPTLRGITLPSGKKAILSDTVGFISDLPHELVAAFRATLEEVLEADVVIHVRDMSHEDADAQNADVVTVLKDLGLDDMELARMIEAQNKIDLLSPEDQAILSTQARRRPLCVPVSARTGEGMDALMAVVEEQLGKNRQTLDLDVSLADGAMIAWLYRHGEIVERRDDETVAHIRIRLDPADQERFRHRFGTGLTEFGQEGDGGDRDDR